MDYTFHSFDLCLFCFANLYKADSEGLRLRRGHRKGIHTITYHAAYNTLTYHIILYHTLHYHTQPYHIILYLTLPNHTIPYLWYIPYNTILFVLSQRTQPMRILLKSSYIQHTYVHFGISLKPSSQMLWILLKIFMFEWEWYCCPYWIFLCLMLHPSE